jgi:hypothetical protein
MLPSLHDNYLTAYEVNCETREITLHARRAEWAEEQLSRSIVFGGVEGYHFKDDAFGNIIFSLQEIPIEQLLSEYRPEIAESHHRAGAPGPWAADLASALQVLTAKGVKGFILSSSYGLSGWVLAREASVSPR